MGPIGQGFTAIAGAPAHAARRRRRRHPADGVPRRVAQGAHATRDWQPLVLMGSEIPFPFRARPSTILVPGMPDGVIACMPLLDDWGVPSRLATLAGFPGCFDGYVTDLAAHVARFARRAGAGEVEMFACGPTPMLQATARVARRFGVPCQVSLEEFMACAVGGCAGCAVPVVTGRARDEARVRGRAGVRRERGVSAGGVVGAAAFWVPGTPARNRSARRSWRPRRGMRVRLFVAAVGG